MNAKVRDMISEAIKSDGVEEIFKLGEDDATEIDIFAGNYLSKIEKIKLPNTKVKLLQQLMKRAITDFKKVNKIKGVDFSKKFQTLVEKYNERDESDVLRSEELEGIANEIFELIEELRTEMNSFTNLGINIEEKAFYDILKALAIKYEFTYPEDKLLELAKLVKAEVDDKAKYTDWSQREDIKAELKANLVVLLAKNDYPPVDRNEVYKRNLRTSPELQEEPSSLNDTLMNRPYSIKIYLPDGTPDGLKIIEKSNWNGKCPRSSFPDNKAREEFSNWNIHSAWALRTVGCKYGLCRTRRSNQKKTGLSLCE